MIGTVRCGLTFEIHPGSYTCFLFVAELTPPSGFAGQWARALPWFPAHAQVLTAFLFLLGTGLPAEWLDCAVVHVYVLGRPFLSVFRRASF